MQLRASEIPSNPVAPNAHRIASCAPRPKSPWIEPCSRGPRGSNRAHEVATGRRKEATPSRRRPAVGCLSGRPAPPMKGAG
jgi:hypothetical protein